MSRVTQEAMGKDSSSISYDMYYSIIKSHAMMIDKKTKAQNRGRRVNNANQNNTRQKRRIKILRATNLKLRKSQLTMDGLTQKNGRQCQMNKSVSTLRSGKRIRAERRAAWTQTNTTNQLCLIHY